MSVHSQLVSVAPKWAEKISPVYLGCTVFVTFKVVRKKKNAKPFKYGIYFYFYNFLSFLRHANTSLCDTLCHKPLEINKITKKQQPVRHLRKRQMIPRPFTKISFEVLCEETS